MHLQVRPLTTFSRLRAQMTRTRNKISRFQKSKVAAAAILKIPPYLNKNLMRVIAALPLYQVPISVDVSKDFKHFLSLKQQANGWV